METQTFRYRDARESKWVTKTSLYYVSLAKANVESIAVDQAKTFGSGTCLSMKGAKDFVTVVENPSLDDERFYLLSTDVLCFDSAENAARAAKALRHAASLCGGKTEKEPF
jgi:hypothetical protein